MLCTHICPLEEVRSRGVSITCDSGALPSSGSCTLTAATRNPLHLFFLLVTRLGRVTSFGAFKMREQNLFFPPLENNVGPLVLISIHCRMSHEKKPPGPTSSPYKAAWNSEQSYWRGLRACEHRVGKNVVTISSLLHLLCSHCPGYPGLLPCTDLSALSLCVNFLRTLVRYFHIFNSLFIGHFLYTGRLSKGQGWLF